MRGAEDGKRSETVAIQRMLRLYIKILAEEPPRLQKLEEAPSVAVRSILKKVECCEPSAHLALVYDGKELPADADLESCGIPQDATLHVICTKRTLRLRTCTEALHPPGSLARKLRQHAAQSRRDSQFNLQRNRAIEDIVAPATPGSLLRPATRPQSVREAPSPTESDSEDSYLDDDDDEEPSRTVAVSGAVTTLPPLPKGAPVWEPGCDDPPHDCLQLEWAAGFSPSAGISCVNGNEILYSCGGLGVVQSMASSLQRHLCGHASSIRCLCVHPAGRIVATAAATTPIHGDADIHGDEILVWDSATTELLMAVPFVAAVLCIAFDGTGELLAGLSTPSSSLGLTQQQDRSQQHHDHTPRSAFAQAITLWRWNNGTVLSSISVHEGPYRCLLWNKPIDNAAQRMVLLGPRHLVLLALPKLEEAAQCSFTRCGRPAGKLRSAAALSTGMLVSGCRMGELQFWSEAQLLRRVQAHDGTVRAIATAADGRRFASGGDDGAVLLWKDAVRLRRIDVASALSGLLDTHGRALTTAGSSLPRVYTLAWLPMSAHPGDEGISVGTQQGELHWISLSAAQHQSIPLQRPHATSRRVKALATHPTKLHFASVGGDGYLRLWHVTQAGPRTALLSMQPLLRPCTCVAFDGNWHTPTSVIAVGEDVAPAGRRPKIHICSADKLLLLQSISLPSTGQLGAAHGTAALRFSPDNRLLAVGCTDGVIHVMDGSQKFAPLFLLCDGAGQPAHGATVIAMDWSEDSLLLRSGCAMGRLCFWEAAARRQLMVQVERMEAEAESVASAHWSSSTVANAWGAVGVWPAGSQLSESHRIGKRLRGLAPALDRSPEGDALVTGDIYGQIRMFRWPVFANIGAGHRSYRGHGCSVDAVAFTWDDRFVISLGSDGSCLIWRHWNEPGEHELAEVDSDAEEERAARLRHCASRELPGRRGDGSEQTFSVAKVQAINSAKDPAARLRALPQWQQVAEGLADGAKTEGRAVSRLKKTPNEAPVLAWVHGYRGHDCRGNVFFSAAGDAVYPAASVVVLVGVAEGGRRRQRFFMEHTDDVLCLAIHPERTIFASGQKAFARGGQGCKAPLLVWRATQQGADDDLTLIVKLKGLHESAVTSVAFSSDGQRVLSAGLDPMHSIAIWDWQNGTLLLTQASSPRPLLGLAFLHPRHKATPSVPPKESLLRPPQAFSEPMLVPAVPVTASVNEERIVICGERELRFGRARNGLKWRKAVFGASAEMQTLPCVAVNNDGRVLTGTRRGDLYVWQSDHNRLHQRHAAHRGALQCISVCVDQSSGAGFATGGADGLIMLWSIDYKRIRILNLNDLCKREPLDNCGRPLVQPPARGMHVRAVCWDATEQRLLVGTESNEVLRVQLLSAAAVSVTVLTQGHQGGWIRTIRGVSGDRESHGLHVPQSAILHIGDDGSMSSQAAWRTVQAVAEHPRIAQYATAGDDGVVKLWSLLPHRLHASRRIHSTPRCIAFSPDGAHLTMGCTDGSLLVLLSEQLELYLERAAPGLGMRGQDLDGSSISVNAIAYSPDGLILAVGDAQRALRLYRVHGEDNTRAYRQVSRCLGHSGALTHLGWSADSSCVRSNCDFQELRFWDSTGKQLDTGETRIATLLAEKEWASTDGGVLYSRETLGVHSDPELAVCALGISHGTGDRLLVVGDKMQRLRVLPYPCTEPPTDDVMAVKACTGHSAAISAVRFSFNDRYIISAGGEDLAIFVWRMRPTSAVVTAVTVLDSETGATVQDTMVIDDEEGELDDEDDSDVEADVDLLPKVKGIQAKNITGDMSEESDDNDDDDVFVEAAAMGGEQLGAVKPWQASIFPPSQAPPDDELIQTPPEDGLRLKWVYGFRGFDTRRAAMWTYTSDGAPRVVYPAAAVVVVYDPIAHAQTFFRNHTDDVLGVSVHVQRRLVASGQKSFREGGRMHKPTIWVWSSADGRAIKGPLVFTGCNQRWISLLCFNMHGDILCSVGADNDHTLVLWAWEQGTAVRAIPTQKERIYACRCSPHLGLPSSDNSGTLVLAGKAFARLYGISEMLKSNDGARRGETQLTLPGRDRAAAQLAVGFPDPSVVVIGSATGSMHIFALSDGTLLASCKQAHVGPIHVLCEADGMQPKGEHPPLLSCGKDGTVHGWQWNPAQRQLTPMDVSGHLATDAALQLLNRRGSQSDSVSTSRLRAMDWSAEHGLLIGTHASELLLVRADARDCNVLVHGHAQRPALPPSSVVPDAARQARVDKDSGFMQSDIETEVQHALGAIRTLAVPLNLTMCVTGGDDAVVRLWDLHQRRLLFAIALPCGVSCLCFDESATGSTRLAVGLESGDWRIYALDHPTEAMLSHGSSDAVQLKLVAQSQSDDGPRRRVTDARFSPDSQWLAVASADAGIYLYDCRHSFALVAHCYGHSSAVTHLDWSEASDVIRSNDRSHELRFWDAPSGEPITQASACRDLPWTSFRVTLAYHCQGIFRNRADGASVNAIDRSSDGQLLATVDDLGQINLFRFPCVRPEVPGSPNRLTFAAHASAALDCQWVAAMPHDGQQLPAECIVTVGGFDLTLMQWELIRGAPGEAPST